MKIDLTHWQQISQLLDAALDLEVDQREQWLKTLPEHMSELTPTLRVLLQQSANAETADFLSKPPDFTSALVAEYSQSQWADQEFQTDKVIGSYRLIRELGRGGMGTVWLAERVDGKLKRQVALKLPYTGPNQRQFAERLVREREILARLEHRNIARIYDADIAEGGQPFLVLEYIDGQFINDYCDSQRLNIPERLQLFQQVLEAVCYAHSHLVIHRDLKPSNILITNDGVAHLLDFGIAKLTTDGAAQETALTQIGGRVLTLDYASPEQIAGNAMTTVSDVYSLGVLLYELLVGARPYRLQRPTPLALEEAIIAADIVAPSCVRIDQQVAASRSTTPRHLTRLLHGDLETLLLNALKKAASERYSSADALLDDVKRYINDQPILAQPDSQWYRAKKFVARNRLAVASVLAIALTLIGGSGAALWQAHQATLQRDRAIASAARSEAVTDFLQLMVTEVADANEPITMPQLIARSEDIANRTYVGDANQQAAILEVLGDYYMSFGRAADAARAFTKALGITGSKSDNVLKAKLLCLSAAAEFELGNTNVARQKVQAGVELSGSAADPMAYCLHVQSYIKFQDTDLRGMLHDIQRAQLLLKKSGINNPVFISTLMSDAAQAYADMGEINNAEREYSQAIELLNKIGRGDTRVAMQIHNSWGVAHDTNGDPLGALQHYDKAIEIANKRGLSSHNDEISTADRAYALHQLARYDEALDAYSKAIAIAERNGNVIEATFAKQAMAITLLMSGRVAEADNTTSKIVPMIGRELPAEGVNYQNIVFYKALRALRLQQYQESIDKFTQLIDMLLSRNERSSYLQSELNYRGEAHLGARDDAEALNDALAAWEIGQSNQGDLKYSSINGRTALLLAKIYHVQHKDNESDKWATVAAMQLQGSVGAKHPATVEAKQLLTSVSLKQ